MTSDLCFNSQIALRLRVHAWVWITTLPKVILSPLCFLSGCLSVCGESRFHLRTPENSPPGAESTRPLTSTWISSERDPRLSAFLRLLCTSPGHVPVEILHNCVCHFACSLFLPLCSLLLPGAGGTALRLASSRLCQMGRIPGPCRSPTRWEFIAADVDVSIRNSPAAVLFDSHPLLTELLKCCQTAARSHFSLVADGPTVRIVPLFCLNPVRNPQRMPPGPPAHPNPAWGRPPLKSPPPLSEDILLTSASSGRDRRLNVPS